MIVTSITEEFSVGTSYSVLISIQQFSGGFVFSENTPIGVFSLNTTPPENSITTSSDKTSSKTSSFLMFLGDIERDQCHEID